MQKTARVPDPQSSDLRLQPDRYLRPIDGLQKSKQQNGVDDRRQAQQEKLDLSRHMFTISRKTLNEVV